MPADFGAIHRQVTSIACVGGDRALVVALTLDLLVGPVLPQEHTAGLAAAPLFPVALALGEELLEFLCLEL